MTDALYREVYEKLERTGQQHLLAWYDELTDSEKEALLTGIRDADFSYLRYFNDRNDEAEAGVIEPLPAMTISEIAENETAFHDAGLRLLGEGRVAAVILAGGMGTRLGHTGPKGTFDIGVTRHIYIFQRLVENLMLRVHEAGRWIRLFIMTSELNDDETRDFFEAHGYFGYDPSYVHFFRQTTAPCVDENGMVLLETKSRIAASPSGNGGWFSSMLDAGFSELMEREQIEFLSVFSVDNVLQSVCDPVFIGAMVMRGCRAGAKVVRKVSPDEKVGSICMKNGAPAVVEYSEMTDALREKKDENGEYAYGFGVLVNYLFSVSGLREVTDAKLPVHFAHKKIPHIDADGNPVTPREPNGWKFEYFIFDVLPALNSCLPFEVAREREFAPVKNRTGADSVDTARELCRLSGIPL
ncbi:MAG: UDPGP type 1 family protein [Lachnospiraceae bacterium]|nr:UDPGP type 1 family protein [Lachnospiraceae bacterium]